MRQVSVMGGTGQLDVPWQGTEIPSDRRPLDVMRERLDQIFLELGLKRTAWDVSRPNAGMALLQPVLHWDPDVSIYRKGDTVIVRAELPGLDRDHVHVDVGTDEMTISGEWATQTVAPATEHHRSERNHGTFFRAIPLVDGADAEHCAAHFRDGVLEVEFQLPHEAKAKRKSIAID